MQELNQFIKTSFSNSVNLDIATIFDQDLSLSQIMAKSETLHNSVDLMEAFAKVANQVKRQYGVRVRLPAFPLETRISEVLSVFVQEIERSAAPAESVQEGA